jgi:hypothetical protein
VREQGRRERARHMLPAERGRLCLYREEPHVQMMNSQLV